ncbi:MAG: hypothetical protein PHR25_02125 [Clostridia bacterium]|nr:hypothetical protein [Clostridia bacterium]
MTRRELAREITKFCYYNNIFDVNKHYYAEMIDAVEINLQKLDYLETISKVIEDKINQNQKYIKTNKKLNNILKNIELQKGKVVD